LQRFECVSFIHHTYIIAEHFANGNENLSQTQDSSILYEYPQLTNLRVVRCWP
jgi:hypothetical protein